MRFATSEDKILMWIGSLAAFANGAATPAFSLIFSDLTDSFSNPDTMVEEVGWNAMYFSTTIIDGSL